jgi:hypothetical protein
MPRLDDTTINALAGIAGQLGEVLGNGSIGTVANAAAALAKLLDGNGPVAVDVAEALRSAIRAREAAVFAALDRAAGDGDDGA